MRLRDKERERDFGQRSEEATIGGGGCDEPALPIWFRDLGLFQREISRFSLSLFFFINFF